VFKVLSIDGGGVRGIFAARFLQRCEDLGVKLSEAFDLIVGTSTGGIIALAAAYDKRMEQVVELYSTHAPEVFRKPRIGSFRAGSLLRAKYDNRALIQRLQEVFTSEATFDLPSCPVRIQSFNLQTGTSKIFRAGEPYRTDAGFLIWQVAAATSAAPTYFPTFRCGERGLFVDGGIWANNPALVALVEAVLLHKRLDDVAILSLGTGASIFRDNRDRTGYFSWGMVWGILDLLSQAQSDGVHQLARELGRGNLHFYRRVSPSLKDSESSLDATTAIASLRLLAEEAFEEALPDLRQRFF
jgi:patatin-like phospholipase/acyl hydrolase